MKKRRRWSFNAKDHTKIIKAVIENAYVIAIKLNLKNRLSSNDKPNAKEILEALLETGHVDDKTKDIILRFLKSYDESVLNKRDEITERSIIEEGRDLSIGQLIQKIEDADTIDKMIQMLSDAKKDPSQSNNKMIRVGITKALAILRDGSKSIYSQDPKLIFVRVYGTDIAKNDAVGALESVPESFHELFNWENHGMITFSGRVVFGAIKSSSEKVIHIFWS